MDDDNGIELSLGLSCGGFAGKSKARDSSSDSKTEEGGHSKLMGGNLNVADVSLKHFFHTNFEKLESSGLQRSESGMQHQENFWTDLGKSSGQDVHVSSDAQGSQFTRFQELWGANNRLTEVNEESSHQVEIGGKLWADASNKRKMAFEDIKHQKKHDAEHINVHGKCHLGINLVKNSHVSVATEEGSSAENEDVAESEAEGSTSRLVSQNDESTKQQKTSSIAGKQASFDLAFGAPLQLQSQPAVTVAYSLPVKVPSANAASNFSGLASVMHLVPPSSGERTTTQSVNPGNLQLAFGYSTVQLPTLETGSTWGIASNPQFSAHIGKFSGDAEQNADHSKDDLKLSQATIQAPQHIAGEPGTCSSSLKDDEMKDGKAIFKPKEISEQSLLEGFPEGSAIRPCIVPGLKFGGCGSYPDLPWVSTTGPGPNGKTISGVPCRFGPNQIKIVCACHGSHMSADEFIQHASADANNAENGSALASFPSNNPAASAQS